MKKEVNKSSTTKTVPKKTNTKNLNQKSSTKKAPSTKKTTPKKTSTKIDKKIIIIIALIILIAIIVGASSSFAFFTDTKFSAEQIFTTGTLKIKYEGGKNITNAVLIPTDEAHADSHNFMVQNTGSIAANYTIKFKDVTITKKDEENQTINVVSENLHWALYNATVEEIDNKMVYTVATNDQLEDDLVASGIFTPPSPATVFDSSHKELSIVSTPISIEARVDENDAYPHHPYILKIWLQDTNEIQNDDQGLSFSAQVEVSATQ